MTEDIVAQAEASITHERVLWAALIDVDDGTPAVWEDLVRRSAPHVGMKFFMPRWEADSAFTPPGEPFNGRPDIYGLTEELAAEWRAYRARWQAFLNRNPRAHIASMMSDVSESHEASSFPHGWEHLVRDWALAGFPEDRPFHDGHRIVTDAWKNQLRDAMRRAGPGWVFYGDDIYEWR